INTARSPEKYRDAINHLLSFLNDPATYVKLESGPANVQAPAASINAAGKTSRPDIVREGDGVTVIDLMTHVQLVMADQTKAGPLGMQISTAITKAKAIVLDCRGQETVNKDEADDDYSSYFFDNLLRSVLTQVADRPVTLGFVRYRKHSGYPTQA